MAIRLYLFNYALDSPFLEPALLAFALLIEESGLAVRATILVCILVWAGFIRTETILIERRTTFATSLLFVFVFVTASVLTEGSIALDAE